jgi:hypothetical protein
MSGVMNPGRRDVGLLATVMKGLQIAKDVYGIRASQAQLDAHEADQQAAKQRSDGVLTPGDEVSMFQKGFVPAQEGDQNSFAYKDSGGLVKYAAKAQEQKLTPLQKVTTVEGGKKVEKFVRPEEGQSFESPPDTSGAPNDYKRRQDSLNATTDLRKEYNNDPTTKRTIGVIDAYKSIRGAADQKAPTGATDIRLVYSFMKAMDPGSTVREGEYATAENSGGVPERVSNMYNRLMQGERLTPEQRSAFAAEAESLLADQLESQKDTDRRYESLAKQYGVDARSILDGRFAARSPAKANQGNQPQVSQTPANQPKSPPPLSVGGKAGPGTTVQIQGKRYRVLSDGNSLEEISATGAN